jgi:predicted ester cyclase
MIDRRHLVAATAMAFVPANAFANDRSVVESFYTQFLSADGAKDVVAEGARIMTESFESYGDYSGKAKRRDELVKLIIGFRALIPDLRWTPVEILEAGGRFVVRGRAQGTPKGPLFGVDGKGKAFSVMSIDIHELSGGRISRVYHVEDWAGALRQLAAA